MSVLAIDTSTAHCTVAFGERRAGVVAPTGHAEHLADLIREVVPDMTAMERIVVGMDGSARAANALRSLAGFDMFTARRLAPQTFRAAPMNAS